MQIQFMGVPGQKHLIQASDNMVNWTNITTVTMGSSGIATYTDKNAYKQAHQFYRVVPTL